MARSNNTQVAVMGMLALGARTGYDIRRECEEKLSHFWSESYGQIYPVLRDLHARGYVHKEVVTEAGRRKNVYALTDDGRRVLRDWLATPAQPLKVRDELLLKVFMGRIVDTGALDAVLEDFAERVEQRLAVLEGIGEAIRAESAEHPDAPYWLLTLDFGLRSLAAQAEWALASRSTLQSIHASAETSA
jgi:DNA-binding PadR family transcriptional regulator